MVMLPDVDQDTYDQYERERAQRDMDQRISGFGAEQSMDSRIASLGSLSSDSLTNPLGSGNAAPAVPAAAPSSDSLTNPIGTGNASVPEPAAPTAPEVQPELPSPSAPPTLDFGSRATSAAQPPATSPAPSSSSSSLSDWFGQTLGAVGRAGGDVAKFASSVNLDAGNVVGSVLGAASQSGADVAQLASSLAPPPSPAAATGATSRGGGAAVGPPGSMPQVQVDSSSPEAFIRSVTPAAKYIEAQTGIPADAMIGMAANETGFGKFAAGNNLFGIKGKGSAGSTNAGTWEDYGNGPVQIRDDFRAYNNATESFQDFTDFLRDNPRYAKVMSQVDQGTNTEHFVQGLKDAGYMTDPNYVGKIKTIADRYAPIINDASGNYDTPVIGGIRRAADATTSAVRGAADQISQFGNPQLTNDEAYAACGPAAAVRFASMYGRNPSLREATDLAKQVGWTSGSGMAGISSEQKLMEKLGVPTKLVSGAQWDQFAQEAQTGNPVTISTAGHYFFADGYDPTSGAFHVGRSGTDLRGGSEWMTPAQMTARMGAVQGALFADNPGVPAPSNADRDSNPLSFLDRTRQSIADGISGAKDAVAAPLTDIYGKLTSAATGIGEGLTNFATDPTMPLPRDRQPTSSDSLTNPLGSGNAATSGPPTIQSLADRAGQTLTDLTPDVTPPEPGTPLARVLKGESIGTMSPADQLTALQQWNQGYSTAREKAAENVNPARDVPVLGGLINQMTDPEQLALLALTGPVGKYAGEAVGGLGGKLVDNALQGGLGNAGYTAAQGGSPGDVAKAGLEGAAFGAGIAGAGAAAGPVLSKALGALDVVSPPTEAFATTRRVGESMEEYRARSRNYETPRVGAAMLQEVIGDLQRYPEWASAGIRHFISTANGEPSEVASIARRWMEENPRERLPEAPPHAAATADVAETLDTNLRTGGGSTGGGMSSRVPPEQMPLGAEPAEGRGFQERMPVGEGEGGVPSVSPDDPGLSLEMRQKLLEQRAINERRAAGRPTEEQFVRDAPRAEEGVPAVSLDAMTSRLGENARGEPGLSIEQAPGSDTMHYAVYRDAHGTPVGALEMVLDPVTGQPKSLNVAVDPAYRRQGIATSLYKAAQDAGYDVEAVSGANGYTDAGARLAYARKYGPKAAEDIPESRYGGNEQRPMDLQGDDYTHQTEMPPSGDGPFTPPSTPGEGPFTPLKLPGYIPKLVGGLLEDGNRMVDHARPITEKTLQSLADKTGETAERIRKVWKPGEQGDAVVRSLSRALDTSAENLARAQEMLKLDPTNEAARADVVRGLARHQALQETAGARRPVAGAMLDDMRVDRPVTGQKSATAQLEAMAKRAKMTPDEYAERLSKIDMSDPDVVSSIAQVAHNFTFGDKVASIFYMNLLSNPLTHIRNMVGNTAVLPTRLAESALASAFDPLARKMLGDKGPRQRYIGEVPHQVIGMATALKDDRAWLDALKYGVSEHSEASDFGRMAKEPFAGKGPLDAIGWSGRGLEAEDLVFKGINGLADIHGEAYRLAKQKGLSGDALEEEMAKKIHAPTPEMLENAKKGRAYRTFQQRDEASSRINAAIEAIPGTKGVIPFVRTPMNIAKYMLERSPLGAVKIAADYWRPGGRAALKEAGSGDLADRMARTTMGSTMMFGAYKYAEAGNLTGRAPNTPEERDQWEREGKTPYSFRNPLTGDWVSYAALQPYAGLLGAAADVQQAVADGKMKEQDAGAIGTAAAFAAGRGLLNQQWTQGAVELLDLLQKGSPDPSKDLGRIATKYAADAVPGAALWRSVARMTDNTIRDPDVKLTPEGIAQGVAENLPGVSRMLPADVDAFGYPRIRPTATRSDEPLLNQVAGGLSELLNPLPGSKVIEDPVDIELKRLDKATQGLPSSLGGYTVEPGFVGKDVSLLNGKLPVRLDNDEQRKYQEQSGRLSYAMLSAEIGTKEWDAKSDAEKAKRVSEIYSKAREVARAVEEPGLLQSAAEQLDKQASRAKAAITRPTATPAGG